MRRTGRNPAGAASAGMRASLRDHPDRWQTNHCFASCLRTRGRAEEALPLAERAASLVPAREGVAAHVNLARCLLDLHREAEAEATIRRALAECPDAAPARQCLADILCAREALKGRAMPSR